MADDKVTQYAELQRSVYDRHATSREAAEGLVSPEYDLRRREAGFQIQWALNEHLRRRHDPSAPLPHDLRVLDFGCGVGRLMEAWADEGFSGVDGVDISERMLGYARESPLLKESRFWRTSGHDCGGAPEATYDLVHSFITMQHISMRQTRIEILRAMSQCLKPGGTVVIEFPIYPSIDAARIPTQHVPWRANRASTDTNSAADVWITPDQLGEVYDDFRLYFVDLSLTEIDQWTNPAATNDADTYNAAYPVRQNPLLISGSTRRHFVQHYRGFDPDPS